MQGKKCDQRCQEGKSGPRSREIGDAEHDIEERRTRDIREAGTWGHEIGKTDRLETSQRFGCLVGRC